MCNSHYPELQGRSQLVVPPLTISAQTTWSLHDYTINALYNIICDRCRLQIYSWCHTKRGIGRAVAAIPCFIMTTKILKRRVLQHATHYENHAKNLIETSQDRRKIPVFIDPNPVAILFLSWIYSKIFSTYRTSCKGYEFMNTKYMKD